MARFGRAFSSAFNSAFGGNKQYTTVSLIGLPQAKYWDIGDPAGVKSPSAASGPPLFLPEAAGNIMHNLGRML